MKNVLRSVILALVLSLTSGLPAQAQQQLASAEASTVAMSLAAPSEALSLSPASPNPFETTTRFSITAEERQQVRVEVFNMLGRRVATLFDGVLPASTPRTLTWEPNGLPSGLYLYRATGPRGTATRQVTFLR